jgi:hypothetical protein
MFICIQKEGKTPHFNRNYHNILLPGKTCIVLNMIELVMHNKIAIKILLL